MDTSLKTLLDQGKYDEASKLLDAMFTPARESTQGDMYVDLATMYLGTMNDINSKYVTSLEDAIATLEEVRAHEKKTVSNLKMKEVRAKLNAN